MDKEKIEIVPGDTPWEAACKIINAEHETIDFFGQKQSGRFLIMTICYVLESIL
jgi:hypothetical protein